MCETSFIVPKHDFIISVALSPFHFVMRNTQLGTLLIIVCRIVTVASTGPKAVLRKVLT